MNISDIVYLLSNQFDYSKMMTIGNTGPTYPASMGWSSDFLSNYAKQKGKVKLIDCRITDEECEKVRSLILESGDLFVFSLVDPYKERIPYLYKMIHTLKDRPNVVLISKFQAEEAVADLLKEFGKDRFLILNHAYNQNREREVDFRHRKNKLIFSGKTSKDIYPERYIFWRSMRRSPLRFRIDFLNHPGYPDIGKKKKHNITGEAYLNFLSQYTFMFASASRCGLEFQKFGECAYASCVPVGAPPKTFHEEMRAPFLDLDFERLTLSTLRVLLKSRSELHQRAENYRAAFRKWRNPDYLNQILLDFLGSLARV